MGGRNYEKIASGAVIATPTWSYVGGLLILSYNYYYDGTNIALLLAH